MKDGNLKDLYELTLIMLVSMVLAGVFLNARNDKDGDLFETARPTKPAAGAQSKPRPAANDDDDDLVYTRSKGTDGDVADYVWGSSRVAKVSCSGKMVTLRWKTGESARMPEAGCHVLPGQAGIGVSLGS